MCYTKQVFEEVGLLETIEFLRLLPARLTPSNASKATLQQFVCGGLIWPLASAPR
jgi:hypothetical protein